MELMNPSCSPVENWVIMTVITYNICAYYVFYSEKMFSNMPISLMLKVEKTI